ncbi:MAG: zinc ribbon domain-containing protein [Oscillospiraceae bacterium]|nr:zinc ribbon domain-containing protein [Oscillospiraceae bacterium]
MPFYTFVCNSCGKQFEVRCSVAEKDSGSVVCPGCGANELDRVFQGFSVAVKSPSPSCGQESACPRAAACGGCCGRQA